MYHPASGNLGEAYVELYNPGPGSVDLSNWRFGKGILYSFPAGTVLIPGACLAVASEEAAFTNNYPGITNYLAGWTGTIGSDVRLDDAVGNVISEVNYSSEGDWAARRLGAFVYGHQGWEWYAPHDGGGSSLELVNPSLPNSYGQNWGASEAVGGTPGRPNSILETNEPPMILDVAHAPVIPQPEDVVTVTARLLDEQTSGLSASVFYRPAGTTNPPSFTSAPMFDDGAHNDGLAGDRIFAAILPAQPNGAIIEFYLHAQDAQGNIRTYPNVIAPTNSPRTANLLYQVDTGVYGGAQPIYRIIMTELERAELYAIGRKCPDSDSDAGMNATWITKDGVVTGGATTQLRYNVGVRNRGHGSRQSNPNNYHVDIPGDRLWKNLAGINLNSQYTHSQIVGSAVFRRLEVPMPASRAVQVRINSTNLMSLPGLPNNNSFGSYAANEQYNNDFVKRAFALDARGDSYRGIRDSVSCDATFNGVADLVWHGADYSVAAYTNAYFKQNHFLEDDWSDLIDLLAVLNSVNGRESSNYVSDTEQRINVDEWMKYMAVNTLLDNDETCLANGVGDDYALYRGTMDTRFQVLPYDLDTVMGRGLTQVPPNHGIFRMAALPAMNRFMKTPEFAPVYYRWLKTLADTAFSPTQMNPLLDQLLGSFVPQGTIDNMKAFNAAQAAHVLSLIPIALIVSNNLATQSGYPRTTQPTVALSGIANAIDTRSIVVKGLAANWSAWQGAWSVGNVALNPGINQILVQAIGTNGVEVARTNVDIWYDDGSVQNVSGTIAGNTVWSAAGGPYQVSSTLTIASGATLTIEPGSTVYLGSGVNFVVANGGRLLAEGTAAAPIRFTVAPGGGVSWGGATINGSVGSPETRIAYATFEGNGTRCIESASGTLYLDHVNFLTTSHQYLSLDSSSFLVSNCIFPTSSAAFELVHGTGGIKPGGRGIVRECYFGTTTGYNDIMDFTGGNRDFGQPIIQYYHNVFVGGTDDGLDLDGTDAWIEGNIFLHIHKNGAPDSSSAISGGNTGNDTSEITIIGNLFFDCDEAATAKQGNFFTMINNTVVHTTKTGGLDTASGVVNVRDLDPGPPTTFGRGYYLEGNIIVDAEQLVRNYDSAQTTVTLNNNILPMEWNGPGTGNRILDPLLKHIPELEETYFSTWESAQVMWDWFRLLPGSPARGTGPNGLDEGGVIPLGISISGEPFGTTSQTSANLTMGPLRSGFGMPAAGWPEGSGYTHYKWRLDGGVWSAETAGNLPIQLNGLPNGPHFVEVSGKRDAGSYQDDAELGTDSIVTASRTWTVNTAYVPPPSPPTIRLNEILAQNSKTLTNGGATPDIIELYNYGTNAVDVSGMGLTDSASQPYKFTFPQGTALLGAGQYLILFADGQSAAPGVHLGFGIKAGGDDVFLCASAGSGGGMIDSVAFGQQAADYSIGRALDGTWLLCQPTIGSANVAIGLGDQRALRINEWLADELFAANNDFVEIYNPSLKPVSLGGCHLSDSEGAPGLNPISPLSYVAPGGYVSFTADGDATQGADHLNFKLDAEVGVIILSSASLEPIDIISYGPQRTDVAQGRSPSGSDTLVNFAQPTAGGPNPIPNNSGTVTNIQSSVVRLLDITNSWKYDSSGVDRGTAWYQPAFNDSTWPGGAGLFGYETTPSEYPFSFKTAIPAPDQTGGHITVYYRTHFSWSGGTSGVVLYSTNYVDDGAVYYLNGTKVGSLRMGSSVSYSTTASNQPNEGQAEILQFPSASLVSGDNVMAVDVHQTSSTSSDDVFGMQLNAVSYTTNIVNNTSNFVSIVLNEILASNGSFTNANGVTADWVELFNTGSNAVDVADLSLSDDPNAPRKFVFPAGAIIPAGGYLVIDFDDKAPASGSNTGFPLSAEGAKVYLFDKPGAGGGLIDAITFGLQTADFGIGRVPNGNGAWVLTVPTRAGANTTAALGAASSLVVNEWMADPSSGSDWFEIYNSGNLPVALGGLFLTDDLTKKTESPVPSLSFIGTGVNGFIQFLADGDPGAGARHANFKLSKSGEAVAVYSSSGVLINGVSFGAQVTDISQGRIPDGSTTIASFTTTPSPAESNYLPIPGITINELLSHTDPPLEDAVELYNAGAAPVNIGGWFLSNSRNNSKKFRIPDGTMISPKGFRVFYEYQFNPMNGVGEPFTFNSAHGDQVYLSQADGGGNLTGYRAGQMFGAAANGVSFGRYTNSVGNVDFVAMSSRSFGVDNPSTLGQFRAGAGLSNPYPLVGPLVINEIMFQPPSQDGVQDNTQDEFIELLNISAYPVTLFDPMAVTNAWMVGGGIDYTFPLNVSVDPGAFIMLVNFDPVIDAPALAEFRSRYAIDPNVPLYGPYAGHLANGGEPVALYKPDPPQLPPHPDAGFVPYVLVEQVSYSNAAPWQTGAAATGMSLQRISGYQYGNDPANWLAAAPTANRANFANPADKDGDGLTDAWEEYYFGSISDPRAVPQADPDGDGFSNLQEFIAGTNPLMSGDYLKLGSVAVESGTTTIHFTAVSGRTYTIQWTDDLATRQWHKLADVPSQPATGPLTINDTLPGAGTRYYRVVTPKLP